MSEAGQMEFSFVEITLLKDQALGSGSYGSVCKAKCDALTCAAKIMHSILFNNEDPGVHSMMTRFQQECRILSAIKHPNIVQYLGVTTEKDTRMPVLLMELMDESLTHYLERCSESLPFHKQVNFSLDITQALAYLHSNTIQHRDLSSNNILLLGEQRAKVTDFGMSRLERVNSRMTPATTCPGTVVYMPPEALRECPHYTDKIDVFSFGVLLVQILTRKFPEPSNRFIHFQAPDPKNKRKQIKAQTLVKEIDRRQNHIALVNGGDPLLKISLGCLKDKFGERPSSRQLCKLMEENKALDSYKQSMRVVDYKSMYHTIVDEFDQLKETHKKLSTERDTIEELHSMFEQLLEDKQSVIREKDKIIRAQETKLFRGFSLHWKRTQRAPVKFKGRGHTAVVGEKAYFHELDQKKIYQFDPNMQAWEALPDPPIGMGFTIIAIQNLLTTIGGLGNMEGDLHTYKTKGETRIWTQFFPPMGLGWINPFAITTGDKLVVFGRNIESYENMGMVLDLKTSKWTRFETHQFSSSYFHSAFMFATDSTLYHTAGYDHDGPTTKFYSCPLSEFWNPTAWVDLQQQPLLEQTTICVRGRILGLGGLADDLPGKLSTIYKYDIQGNHWEKVGEMDVARSNCMVAVMEDRVIVVGGGAQQDTTSITDIATIDSTTNLPDSWDVVW